MRATLLWGGEEIKETEHALCFRISVVNPLLLYIFLFIAVHNVQGANGLGSAICSSLFTHAPGDARGQAADKICLTESLGVGPDRGGIPFGRRALFDGGQQGRLGLGVEKNPGLAVQDRFQDTTDTVGHHRPATGLGLHRHDTEILLAGEDQQAAMAV